jgi:hypothetical protein
MRTFVTILVAALAVVALVGCGQEEVAAPTGFAPNQTVEAYGYTHGGYVGQAIVTTDAEGMISATLDEAFLPHTLAEVDMESSDWSEDNTVFYVQRGEEVRVAQYVSYAGTNYVGTTVGGAMIYVEADENGEPTGGQDLEQIIIRNQGTMAAYYENIADGGFAVYTEFGGSPQVVSTTSYGSLFKRGSEYWNFGIGWQGNIDAIEEAAIEFGTGYSLDEMTRGDDNFWSLADATTGATASDFVDYFNLIQNAVGRLAMQ